MSRLQHDSPGMTRRPRRFPRRQINVDAEFSPVNIKLNTAQNMSTVQGFVKDLSPSGLFAELPLLYRVGTRFQVRLVIEDKLFAFYAIVWRVNQKLDEDKPTIYGHGMKITTASEDTLQAIVNMISFG